MRIGFLIYGSLDTQTGGYIYDRFVVQGLKKLGHEVEVLSLPCGSYLKKLLQGFLPTLTRRLLIGSYDVLVQDELCYPTLVAVNTLLRRQQGPVLVALVHHLQSQEQRNCWCNRLLAHVEGRYLNSVDGFIHNSATTRSVTASLISHPKPEVVAYPAGSRLQKTLSVDEIGRRADKTGALQLLFFGNIMKHKGLLPLLEDLCRLDRRLWHLNIVGSTEFDPTHVNIVRQLISKRDMEESVSFFGFLPDGQLVEILKNCHIFCMPYAYEGFGMAMLESMAFGLPAIASLQGAAKETICHGENGFLLAAGDRKGLHTIIYELYQNRSKLAQLALSARRTYEDSADWQEGVLAIEYFLKEMVATAGRRAEPN